MLPQIGQRAGLRGQDCITNQAPHDVLERLEAEIDRSRISKRKRQTADAFPRRELPVNTVRYARECPETGGITRRF